MRWKVAAPVLASALVVAAYQTGLVAIEHHRGFFAPVWDPDGRHVYVLERETRGAIWGLGWEFFTPPASSYVLSDRLSLYRLDGVTGAAEVLERLDGSPLVGRVTKHYRGRIFNVLSARIVPTPDGAEFSVSMNVPRVPTSESWSLAGTWRPGQPSNAHWAEAWAGNMAAPDEVLQHGVELMTVPGPEAFSAAVLAVTADGTYRVLRETPAFGRLYATGVPPREIALRSGRARIERGRELRRVQADLTAEFRAQGLGEGAATLRAYDEMEERGYLPKGPRLVATPVDAPPEGVRVFDIPSSYLRVGLFQDIDAAIAAPGTEVGTSTGTYLRYDGDDLGPRLEAWREAGHDRFAARVDGALYLLEVRRFEWKQDAGTLGSR